MKIINESIEKELTGYPSIDKPWLKYYSEEALNTPLPECTVYELLWEKNKDHLDDIALMYFGKKISYCRHVCYQHSGNGLLLLCLEQNRCYCKYARSSLVTFRV